MSSSSDDLPLRAHCRGKTQHIESSSDSDLPDWIASHQSPGAPIGAVCDSPDSVDDEVVDVKPAAAARLQPTPGLAGAAQLPDQTDTRSLPDPAEAGPSQPQQALPSASKGKKHALPVGQVAVPEGVEGELPVIIPEKLSEAKVLVELEPAEDGTTDLTGDAGAVGRLLVSKQNGEPELKLDLKGKIYTATVVPLAATACVVNIGTTDARVETFLQQYLQLREDGGAAGDSQQDYQVFLGDDDDNYQVADGTDRPAPAAKGKSKAGSAAGHKGRRPAKAGVSKPKARSAGKQKTGGGKSKQ